MVQKFDWVELEQLAMDLDVEEVEIDKTAPSYAEIQARSETALQVLESGDHKDSKGETPDWLGFYFKLRDIGFSWRIATYIAWAASPKVLRWPETQAELAEKVLGLSSPRQISEWRKNDPRIDDAITMLQAAPLHEHRADIYKALVAVATDPDYKGHSDRKLALEMLGDYTPRSRMDIGKAADGDGVKSKTDAELRKAAGEIYKAQQEEGEDEGWGDHVTEEDDRQRWGMDDKEESAEEPDEE